MKSFGPVQEEQEETLVKKEGAMSPNDPKATSLGNVDRSSSGRVARRRDELFAMRDQMDMSSGSASGTFVGGKLVKPVASQPANTPTKAPAVLPPNATAPVDKDALNNTSETPNKPESNKELFERMVANQEQTNNLLRRGNKTTADLKDSF
jgi:hypothetical protein